MTLKEALKRIEQLEQKVRELEARPQQIHHHYIQQPQPLLGQSLPGTGLDPWRYPQITWGGGSGTTAGGITC